VGRKKSQKVTRGSHRNDVSPLTQGLRYQAACDSVRVGRSDTVGCTATVECIAQWCGSTSVTDSSLSSLRR